MMPLGYSSNLHAAETVAELVQVIGGFASEVRRRLGWQRMGLDLRLGSTAIAEMRDDGDKRLILRDALDHAGISAHTINGFPLRPFQAAVVKANAYLPDWTEAARTSDSIALIPISLALSDAETVTISSLPGSFRPFGSERNHPVSIAAAIARWAAVAAHARDATGRTAVLCLEPEPWCFLETSWDVAWFWKGPLQEHGLPVCTRMLGGDEQAARAAMSRHLGICFDTCHVSLAFEDQADAVRRITNAGARIAKCQFSAAPEVRDPHHDRAGVAALRAMTEPRFLHQTCAASNNGSLSKVVDLDRLDTCLARLPNATSVRSHFHIPIFREPTATGLSSTITDSRRGLDACRAVGCEHIAVETYTWSILSAHEQDVIDGTVKELQVLEQISSSGIQSP